MSVLYTDEETEMLASLASEKAIASKLARSGHPAKKAQGKATLEHIAELTTSLHRIAKRRSEEE